MTDRNQRDFYRIDYPLSARPSLVTAEQTLEVLDCSESGLRYALDETEPRPEVGSEIRGVIHFRAAEEIEVDGVVAQLYGRSVAVRFSNKNVPFSTVLKEQHYLRTHYLKGPNELG